MMTNMPKIIRRYSELIQIPTFEERFEYLKLDGTVAEFTFGGSRALNQLLYRCPEWRSVRRKVIIRDYGYDLGHPDHPIGGSIYVHHMNPITIEDIQKRRSHVFDPEFLISVSFETHQAIHYSDNGLIKTDPVTRQPFDTCPWR